MNTAPDAEAAPGRVAVDVRVRGADGKLYPEHPLSREQRDRARRLAHDLHCRDRLSVRQVRRALAENFGIWRSRGAIAADLANYECSRCADRTPGQPPDP
jgi:hypothetical protein